MFYDSKELFSGSVVLCPKCKGYGRVGEVGRTTGANEQERYSYGWGVCFLCQGDRVMVIQLERVEKHSGK